MAKKGVRKATITPEIHVIDGFCIEAYRAIRDIPIYSRPIPASRKRKRGRPPAKPKGKKAVDSEKTVFIPLQPVKKRKVTKKKDCCHRCLSTLHNHLIALCSLCDRAYHMYCLSPPRPSLPPEGEPFHCPRCERKNRTCSNYKAKTLQRRALRVYASKLPAQYVDSIARASLNGTAQVINGEDFPQIIRDAKLDLRQDDKMFRNSPVNARSSMNLSSEDATAERFEYILRKAKELRERAHGEKETTYEAEMPVCKEVQLIKDKQALQLQSTGGCAMENGEEDQYSDDEDDLLDVSLHDLSKKQKSRSAFGKRKLEIPRKKVREKSDAVPEQKNSQKNIVSSSSLEKPRAATIHLKESCIPAKTGPKTPPRSLFNGFREKPTESLQKKNEKDRERDKYEKAVDGVAPNAHSGELKGRLGAATVHPRTSQLATVPNRRFSNDPRHGGKPQWAPEILQSALSPLKSDERKEMKAAKVDVSPEKDPGMTRPGSGKWNRPMRNEAPTAVPHRAEGAAPRAPEATCRPFSASHPQSVNVRSPYVKYLESSPVHGRDERFEAYRNPEISRASTAPRYGIQGRIHTALFQGRTQMGNPNVEDVRYGRVQNETHDSQPGLSLKSPRGVYANESRILLPADHLNPYDERLVNETSDHPRLAMRNGHQVWTYPIYSSNKPFERTWYDYSEREQNSYGERVQRAAVREADASFNVPQAMPSTMTRIYRRTVAVPSSSASVSPVLQRQYSLQHPNSFTPREYRDIPASHSEDRCYYSEYRFPPNAALRSRYEVASPHAAPAGPRLVPAVAQSTSRSQFLASIYSDCPGGPSPVQRTVRSASATTPVAYDGQMERENVTTIPSSHIPLTHDRTWPESNHPHYEHSYPYHQAHYRISANDTYQNVAPREWRADMPTVRYGLSERQQLNRQNMPFRLPPVSSLTASR